MSVCMVSECTVQLLLGVANEACGLRPHGLVLALHGATQVKPPCVEVVCNSVQLDDTVVDCRCASMHGLVSNRVCSYLKFASSWSSSGVLADGVGSVSGC